MIQIDPLGLLAVFAGVAVFVLRMFKRKAKPQQQPPPVVNEPAERARAMIAEQGSNEVSAIMEALETNEAMERLAKRADRRRLDR